MNRYVTIAAILFCGQAWGQSSPGWVTGQVPTAAQWNAAFASKLDLSATETAHVKSIISDNGNSNATFVAVGPEFGNLGWPYGNSGAYNYTHVTMPPGQTNISLAHMFSGNTPGAGTFGPATVHAAVGTSLQKDNYLTSSVEGEIASMLMFAQQGRKGDASVFLGSASKVRTGAGDDTGGVLGFEIGADWIDTSGALLNRVHSSAPFMEPLIGVSGGQGYGFFTESFNGTNYTGNYVGTFNANDPNTKWRYAFIASNARTLAGQYFRIVGDAVSGAAQPGDIIQGVPGSSKTLRTLAGVFQLRNTADNATLLAVTDTGQATFSSTVKTGGYTVATLPAGTVGMRAYVTDQMSACAAVGGALTGGGAVTCPVFHNGSAWVSG